MKAEIKMINTASLSRAFRTSHLPLSAADVKVYGYDYDYDYDCYQTEGDEKKEIHHSTLS